MRFHTSNLNGADKGFILIFAIAVCLLLAVIGLIAGRSVQSALRETRTAIDIAQARALADGGVALGVTWVQSNGDLEPVVCALPGAGAVAVSITDEAGKVPLNTDNRALLLAFFTGLGASRDEAQTVVARIFDYRDADDVVQSGGAEREAYAATGLAFGPKNADFESVAELDRVVGLSHALRDRAKRHLTTAVAAGGVDSGAASDALLQLIASGAGAGGFTAAVGDRPDLPAAFSVRSTRTFYRIRSIGVSEGARYVRETVAARPQRPGETLRYISWTQGELDANDEALLARGGSAPPC
jgi:type II secretory pathway component PulK